MSLLEAVTPPRPTLLSLWSGARKPRFVGRTHILDFGTPLVAVRGMIDSAEEHIDLVEIMAPAVFPDQAFSQRMATYRSAGIATALGTDLFLILHARFGLPRLCEWAAGLGFEAVRIPGAAAIETRETRSDLIRKLSRNFLVLTEHRERGVADPPSSEPRIEIIEDLSAGAHAVIIPKLVLHGDATDDGEPEGSMIRRLRQDLPVERLIFDTESKAEQTRLIRCLGPDVNLTGVPPEEILAVETLRALLTSMWEPGRVVWPVPWGGGGRTGDP